MATTETPISDPAAATSTDWADDNGQLDGSTPQAGGSDAMVEPEYDVEVKLIDEGSPLYSVKSFAELGLYVSEEGSNQT
jgi:hypothetical protein